MRYTRRGPRVSRRTFLKIAVGGGLTAAGFVLWRTSVGGSVQACGEYDLGCIASNLVSGGPPRDGIPSIDSPKFVSASAAESEGWVSSNSIVDCVLAQDGPRAYPRSITVWHEIVNDSIDGIPTSLTFCPLTGSAVAYRAKAPDGSPLTFGTTGLLYNSNLVMYDRRVNSMYPQILGTGISGPNKGIELGTIPVTTTSWEKWRTLHPDSSVLSRDTGYVRDYTVYPYGDYDTNGSVYFPVAYTSSSFPPKKLLTGVRVGRETAALLRDEFRTTVVNNFSLEGEPLVGIFDSTVDYVRVFSRGVDGVNHSFSYDGTKILDAETGTEWSPAGTAQRGSLTGKQLHQKNSFQVMWFGWYAFHPSTALVT